MSMPCRISGLIALAACAIPAFAEQMLTPANGLQALEDVEQNLHKMLGAKTDKALLKVAAPVVKMVDQAVQEVESGNLTKNASSEKVLFAIKALQGLQARLENGTNVDKVDGLQKKLSETKAELTREEGLLNVEKQEMDVLTKEKHAATSHQKEAQKASQEEAVVASLVNMAHDLASANTSNTSVSLMSMEGVNMSRTSKAKHRDAGPIKTIRNNASKASVAENKSMAAIATVPKALQAVLTNLQNQAHNVSADLNRMDAKEKIRENALDKELAKHVPTNASTDAINKGLAMIKKLKKQEQRSYKKARALRQSQLNELDEGIREVETGDVAGLTSLMGRMQAESKTLDSGGKGFLH